MPKLKRGSRNAERTSLRKTVQISNELMNALERRSTEEDLPVATIVRRAVLEYVKLAERDQLPSIDLTGLEERERRGRRGPAPQWPIPVSYVLDPELSERATRLAAQTGENLTELARSAIGLALAREALPLRAMTPLTHGFVTRDTGAPSDEAERAVISVLEEIRSQI
jgi:predicted transcriptional regulator